jgi:hypothetical protein
MAVRNLRPEHLRKCDWNKGEIEKAVSILEAKLRELRPPRRNIQDYGRGIGGAKIIGFTPHGKPIHQWFDDD